MEFQYLDEYPNFKKLQNIMENALYSVQLGDAEIVTETVDRDYRDGYIPHTSGGSTSSIYVSTTYLDEIIGTFAPEQQDIIQKHVDYDYLYHACLYLEDMGKNELSNKISELSDKIGSIIVMDGNYLKDCWKLFNELRDTFSEEEENDFEEYLADNVEYAKITFTLVKGIRKSSNSYDMWVDIDFDAPYYRGRKDSSFTLGEKGFSDFPENLDEFKDKVAEVLTFAFPSEAETIANDKMGW